MQISNVFAGLSDSLKLTKRAEPAAAGAAAGQTPTADAAQPNHTSAIRDILSKYDVTDITPNEFSTMLQKLVDAGAISQTDLQQLATVRVDLDSANVDPDESINLLDFYKDRIEKARQQFDSDPNSAAQRQQLQPMTQRLDWLEKFAAMHAHPEDVGLSALA